MLVKEAPNVEGSKWANHEEFDQAVSDVLGDPKTFSLTLTAEQRKYFSYTAVALLGYFLARHLVKSAVKSLKDKDD